MTGKPGMQEIVNDREAGHATLHGLQRVRHGSATEQQQNRHITSNFAVTECETHVTQ